MDSGRKSQYSPESRNGRNAVVEAPEAGLPGNNGKNAVDEAPEAGLPGNNGKNAVDEAPEAGLPGNNGKNAVDEAPGQVCPETTAEIPLMKRRDGLIRCKASSAESERA